MDCENKGAEFCSSKLRIVICPQCKEAGLKSEVYPGAGRTTLMGWQPYYDEEGKYHSHDPNTTTIHFQCSNGHSWIEKKHNSCWCGWPDKQD